MKKYNEFLKGVYNKENREDFRTHSRKKYIIKKLSWLIDNYDFVLEDINKVGSFLVEEYKFTRSDYYFEININSFLEYINIMTDWLIDEKFVDLKSCFIKLKEIIEKEEPVFYHHKDCGTGILFDFIQELHNGCLKDMLVSGNYYEIEDKEWCKYICNTYKKLKANLGWYPVEFTMNNKELLDKFSEEYEINSRLWSGNYYDICYYFSEDFENLLSLDTLKKDFDNAYKLMRSKFTEEIISKN